MIIFERAKISVCDTNSVLPLNMWWHDTKSSTKRTEVVYGDVRFLDTNVYIWRAIPALSNQTDAVELFLEFFPRIHDHIYNFHYLL